MSRITRVVQASCVSRDGDRSLNAGRISRAKRVALVGEALVGLYAEVGIFWSINALSSQRLSGHAQYASIVGARVSIVTVSGLGSYGTNDGLGAHASRSCYNSHCRITRKGAACSGSRDRDSSLHTRISRISVGVTRVREAFVSLSALSRGKGNETAFSRKRFSGDSQYASIVGTRVSIVTVSGLGSYGTNYGLGTHAGRRIGYTIRRITRVVEAGGVIGNRDGCVNTRSPAH